VARAEQARLIQELQIENAALKKDNGKLRRMTDRPDIPKVHIIAREAPKTAIVSERNDSEANQKTFKRTKSNLPQNILFN
jgi:hypothetical protein